VLGIGDGHGPGLENEVRVGGGDGVLVFWVRFVERVGREKGD